MTVVLAKPNGYLKTEMNVGLHNYSLGGIELKVETRQLFKLRLYDSIDCYLYREYIIVIWIFAFMLDWSRKGYSS